MVKDTYIWKEIETDKMLLRSAETSTFIGTRNSAGSIDLALRSGQSAVRNMTR